MTTKTARALASEQQPNGAVMAELTAYVREHVDPEAQRVTKAKTLPEPPDTSQSPPRTWFDVDYV